MADRKTVNLALQGGGAHGAFTWGVLDRLLEDDGLAFDGICGTSAGAMNGAVLAHGLLNGGRKGAQAALRRFWERVSETGAMSPLRPTPMDAIMGSPWDMDWSPAYQALDLLSRLASPYQVNPLELNPLEQILSEEIDFGVLQGVDAVKLFVCATNVRRGNIKVFTNPELSPKALLASACLPSLFRAVEIDGEPYWDGGFMGNPALFPLIRGCACEDVVIVQINPIRHDELPVESRHILDRVNEISFNATLIRELQAMDLVSGLAKAGVQSSERRLKHIKVHMIADELLMGSLGFSSKLNTSWEFLMHLLDQGRRCADAWLTTHGGAIGKHSTFDVRSLD